MGPWFSDPYTVPKQLLLQLSTIGALCWGFYKNILQLPRLTFSRGRILLGLVGALGLLMLGSAGLRSFAIAPGVICGERLAYVGMSWVMFSGLKLDGRSFLRPILLSLMGSALVLSVIVWLQRFGALPAQFDAQLFPPGDMAATFGNRNMLALYLGMALVGSVLYRHLFVSSGKWYWFAVVLLMAALFGLRCRSVLIGALGASLIVSWVGGRTLLAALRLAGVFALTCSVTALFITFSANNEQFQKSPDLDENLESSRKNAINQLTMSDYKVDTVAERFGVWGDCLNMIADRPLGIGPARFEFGLIPYATVGSRVNREWQTFRSPHNDFLRFAVEDGALAGILIVGLGFMIAIEATRIFFRAKVSVAQLTLIGLLPLLVSEMCFQFPHEVAGGMFLGAMVLAAGILCFEEGEVRERDASVRSHFKILPDWLRPHLLPGIVGLIAGCATYATYCFGYGNYLATTEHRDPAALLKSCQLDPRNYRACVTEAWTSYQSKAAETKDIATSRLMDELWARPYCFPAMNFAIRALANHGDLANACMLTAIYDRLFTEQTMAKVSTMNSVKAKICADIAELKFTDDWRGPPYEDAKKMLATP